MKILVIQDTLRSGGTERQSLLLSRAFAAAGHSATLLTFRPDGALAPADPGAAGFAWRSLQRFDTGLDWFAPGIFTLVERTVPDIVLCQGRMANCYAGGLQDRVRDEAPDVAVIASVRTGKPLPWLYRRSLRRARHVVANSAEARDGVIGREGIPPERITVIRNALVFPSAGTGSAARGSVRERLGAGPGTKVMLCVAMFRPEKNQRELVEIAAGLPPGTDWQLWLAGRGPALAECERLVQSRGLGARVRFPGFHADPSPLYAAADLAVHASWSESLSNFLIEAQAHGLPAVAMEAQGIRECFIPGETGWAIPRGDHPAFRAALTRLMADPPATRQARSAQAAAFARAAFDPARQVAAYLDLFAQLKRTGFSENSSLARGSD